MKAKKIISSSSRVMAVLLLTGVMSVAIWSVVTYDTTKATHYSQDRNHVLMNSTLNNLFSKAYINHIQENNVEIAKLEQVRVSEMNKLKKAKADRNKDYGMVPGMYFHPSHDVSEIAIHEKNISKLDHKIAALQKEGRNMALK